MAAGLTEAVDRRAAAARWLLADVFDEWDLGIVVVAEPHGAAEGFWHGIDPEHPLHDHPSAPFAAEGLADVYRASDRLVGELIEATGPRATIVFSLGGMGSNHSDVASMALLPELLLRWSSGERLLEVPGEWAAEPGRVPLATGGDASWQRAWYPRLATNAARGPVRARSPRVLPGSGAPLVEAGPRGLAGSPRSADGLPGPRVAAGRVVPAVVVTDARVRVAVVLRRAGPHQPRGPRA